MTEKWYQIAQAQLVDLANEEIVGDRILRPNAIPNACALLDIAVKCADLELRFAAQSQSGERAAQEISAPTSAGN